MQLLSFSVNCYGTGGVVISLQCDWAWLLSHVFLWCQSASVDVTLLTGQPNCVAAHVAVPVTESNVRHHAVF
jgi:hypothetical protein